MQPSLGFKINLCPCAVAPHFHPQPQATTNLLSRELPFPDTSQPDNMRPVFGWLLSLGVACRVSACTSLCPYCWIASRRRETHRPGHQAAGVYLSCFYFDVMVENAAVDMLLQRCLFSKSDGAVLASFTVNCKEDSRCILRRCYPCSC